MILGIVGSEAAKFTPQTEATARHMIRVLFETFHPVLVVSGECHLGGVDLYAKEEALKAGLPYQGFPPKRLQWEGGYKQRNIEIATASDHVVCITLKDLPPHYTGMRFKLCYHCGTSDHVKSGGCFTTKYARTLGKTGETLVVI